MFTDALAFVMAGALGLLAAFLLGNAILPRPEELLEFGVRERLSDFMVAGFAWMIWFQLVKNRYRKPIPFWSEVIETTKSLALFSIIHLATIALARQDYSRSIWFFGWMALLPLIPLLRMAVRGLLLRMGWWAMPTLIIGCGENAEEAALALKSEWQMGFEILGFLSPDQLMQGLLPQGSPKDHEVLPADPKECVYVIAMDEADATPIATLLQQLTLAGALNVFIIPPLRGIPLYGTDLTYFFSHEVLLLGLRNNLSLRFSKLLKIGFDLIFAFLLMIPALPLILFAAVMIWREDRGPIFYRQKRLGYRRREFTLLKLRTMRKDADHQLESWRQNQSPEWKAYCENHFKLENDPRLLHIGAFLRRTSIDELPQLINVIRGEMSLVGPRPILPREAEPYGEGLALYASARPGMTGLWQVSGRSKVSFQQRQALDGWYIRNWSLGYDIILLLKTIQVVMKARGAY